MREWVVCPKCGSEEFSIDTEFDYEIINRYVDCLECGFYWVEVYIFAQNEDIKGNPLDKFGNIDEDEDKDE